MFYDKDRKLSHIAIEELKYVPSVLNNIDLSLEYLDTLMRHGFTQMGIGLMVQFYQK